MLRLRRYMPALGGGLNPWIAPTWTRDPATGLWSNAPVAGDEKVVNGGFGSDTNWFYDAGWAIAAGVATLGVAPGSIWQQTQILTANHWYEFTYESTDIANSLIYDHITGQIYTNYGIDFIINRTIGVNFAVYGRAGLSIDNVSAKELSLVQLIAYRNYGRQVSIASAFTRTTGYPGGVVSRLSVNGDGTFNFVHCWHDGTNLHLDTVVNSYTVVSKVNAAAAYGATKAPAIKYAAPDVAQAFYGPLGSEVQIGTDQDVSSVPAGTYAGLFLTGAGTLGDPVIT